jgi:hypothetical protein
MTIKPIPESSILAPRDPSLDNSSDDWPEFELKDVRVHLPDDAAQLTSLLDAAAHYPLTLTGHLEPLPKDQAHLQLQTTTKRAPLIEITGVRTFSYGQFEDGNIGLWAGGKAGWFALKPARAYKAIWMGMVESVQIFYWIVDAYREKRRKGTGKPAPLLPLYTAEELFDKYADEVLEDAKGGKEAAKVIHEQRDFLLASMLAGKEGIAWAKNPLYQHLSQHFPEDHAIVKARLTGNAPVPARSGRQASVNSESSNLKRKRGRPAKDHSQDLSSTREDPMTEDSTRVGTAGKNETKPTGSRRTRRGRDSPSPESSEAETRTPAHNNNDSIRKSMKGRSALRPKASKASKGAAKSGKAPVHDFNATSDDDEEDIAALSPTAAKRRHSHTAQRTSQSQSNQRPHKHDLDEGIDIPSSPTSMSSDAAAGVLEVSDSEATADTDLPLHLKNHPDPIQEDTWLCALDGCPLKVYAASTADSQRLIREHYALHAYDDDARVQLVKKLQHPSLPVGHLMERVRLQAKTDGFPGSKSVVLEGAAAHSRYRPVVEGRY